MKPTGSVAESGWRADVLSALPDLALVRFARPVPARSGGWTVDGWEAWHAVRGEPDPTRVEDVLVAGEAFHAAVAGVARPDFLVAREDPWTYAESVAWGELPVDGDLAWRVLLERLEQGRRPLALPVQPVHGDLLGNVLFADGLPPAVIDWAVYERPALWASAVVVVDAITWHGAPAALVARYADRPGWTQVLVRALLYRIATNVGLQRIGAATPEAPEAYERVVELVATRSE